uniref:Cysteine--tRNA ligase, cytoplasmic n=1 Tax=Lygus hesperus TaxID=30085 RepID=A0A0A9Y965_LYGHE
MQRLGIREPDLVTRVTEYVPQVVEFVQKIMDNGFAYKAESSVFFDTIAYLQAGHTLPKLKPISQAARESVLNSTSSSSCSATNNNNNNDNSRAEGVGNENETTEEEMAEGEGVLTKAVANEKRHPNDFAL